MPPIGAGEAAVEGLDISVPGIACGAGAGAGEGGALMSIPGMLCGAGGMSIPRIGADADAAFGADVRIVFMSMPGIASGLAADGGGLARRATAGRKGLRAPFAARAGALVLALAFGLGLAAGRAGIFMPGIDMPPMLCAVAMPGIIATAATAASNKYLVIMIS